MDVLTYIEDEEGFVSHAYQDHLGYWTIGIGRMIDKRKGGGVTYAEAKHLLASDVAKINMQLDVALPWSHRLNDVRHSVLVAMVFQLGLEGVKRFKRALLAMEVEDWQKAHDEMLDSAWAKQTPIRAHRAAKMMLTGQWA